MSATDIDPLILAVFGPPTADVDLAETQRFGNNVAVVVLLVIATFGVTLRLAARVVQKTGLKIDDYAIIVALVSTPWTSVLVCSAYFQHFSSSASVLAR